MVGQVIDVCQLRSMFQRRLEHVDGATGGCESPTTITVAISTAR